jgi:hypothetical protein
MPLKECVRLAIPCRAAVAPVSIFLKSEAGATLGRLPGLPSIETHDGSVNPPVRVCPARFPVPMPAHFAVMNHVTFVRQNRANQGPAFRISHNSL